MRQEGFPPESWDPAGWAPAQRLPSLLPSRHRVWGWPGSSPLWAALSPLLSGPVSRECVPAGLDGLPAQLRVPPWPAVPGRPLCASCPLPLPVPAWSHGSVLPSAFSPFLPSTAVPAGLASACLAPEPSLGCRMLLQALVSHASPHIPAPGWGFHLPGPGSGAPVGCRLIGREVEGSGIGGRVEGAGPAELSGVPPRPVPSGIPENQSRSAGSGLSSWESLEPGEMVTGPCDNW